MNRRVLVVTHPARAEALSALKEALEILRKSNFEVSLSDPELATELNVDLFQSQRVPGKEGIELVIVLGGDGTILRAAEMTAGTNVPLVGINLGHVGFLAEGEKEDLADAIYRITSHDYEVERRHILNIIIKTPKGGTILDWALNEAALEKGEPTRMIDVSIDVAKRPLSKFGCDGVLVSTATGSTAHAFSAGGPVLWPEVEAMLVVPLAAHALFSRPLVVGRKSQITIFNNSKEETPAVLVCDGRRKYEVPTGSQITFQLNAQPLLFARLSRAPFTDRLVSKFQLPVLGWKDREKPQP